MQRKVVTPNDFYDLADVQARLAAFEDHYNFAARPFNWRYTRTGPRTSSSNASPPTNPPPSDPRRTNAEDH